MAVLIKNRQKKIKIELRRIRSSLKQILKNLNLIDKEISILFVDDKEIGEINKFYFKRDYATNVIAFSMLEGEFKEITPSLLGDIIISVETAYRDAFNGGIEFLDEIDFLLIHGLLHLLGYDHENISEAAKMEDLSSTLFFELRGYRLA